MWILGLLETLLFGPSLPTDTTVSYVVQAVVVRAPAWAHQADQLPLSYEEVSWPAGAEQNALAQVPGLTLKDYIQFQGLSIRGSSSEEVKVLFEGFPFQPQQSGFADLQVLPRSFVGSAEIVRTANASYFGAGAMAGLVNLRLPPPHTQLEVSTGPLRPWTFSIQSPLNNSRWSGRWGWAWEQQTDAFRALDPTHRPLEITHAGGWKTGMWAEFWTGSGRGLILVGWTRRATPWLPWTVPHPDTLETRYLLAGWETPSLRSSLTLWYTAYHTDASPPDRHQEWQWQTQWHHGPWLLDFSWVGLRSTIVGHPQRVHLAPGVRQVFQFGSIQLFASFRLDGYSAPRQMVPTGFFGLHFPLGLYTSISRGFRPPTFNELYWPEDLYSRGNPHLRRETSIEFETGWKIRRSSSHLTVALYRRAYHDMIRWSPDPTGKWRPVNLHHVELMGFETEGGLEIRKVRLIPRGGWIFWHRGPNLIYTPSWTGSMELRTPLGWLRWTWIGSRPERFFGPKRLPAFALLDLGLRVPLWDHRLSVAVTWQNILDQPVAWVRGYPMPGRTWEVRIQWQPEQKGGAP